MQPCTMAMQLRSRAAGLPVDRVAGWTHRAGLGGRVGSSVAGQLYGRAARVAAWQGHRVINCRRAFYVVLPPPAPHSSRRAATRLAGRAAGEWARTGRAIVRCCRRRCCTPAGGWVVGRLAEWLVGGRTLAGWLRGVATAAACPCRAGGGRARSDARATYCSCRRGCSRAKWAAGGCVLPPLLVIVAAGDPAGRRGSWPGGRQHASAPHPRCHHKRRRA